MAQHEVRWWICVSHLGYFCMYILSFSPQCAGMLGCDYHFFSLVELTNEVVYFIVGATLSPFVITSQTGCRR